MNDAAVFHVDRLELGFAPKSWDFAETQRSEIVARFAQMQQTNPALWNGRVLMLHEYECADGVFRGAFFETDYASFRVWHQLGCPGAPVYDCFGAAALLSADNAFVLGVMGEHTANAGRIYFPCGTPDPDDIVQNRVDLEFSIRRELKEETGLDTAALDAEPGWTTVVDGPLIAHIKVLKARATAADLQDRIAMFLGGDRSPELAGTAIASSAADLAPAMPDFVTAFLNDRWARSR
ncbi:MAG TPA: NUDIX hydrolase [Pseudolabrys sp.]|nr:NUDIX hydrolase [Pseudolabrys sp.]